MSARRRHIPLRSCVGCREKNSKRDMLRIVAGRSNGVAFDASGTLSGRGAYLCSTCAAVDGIRKNRLEHTLRTRINNTEWDKVITDLKAHAATPANRQGALLNPGRRDAPDGAVHNGGAND
jgi:predicted RNA-binding protein YlxR (DUF448 family)